MTKQLSEHKTNKKNEYWIDTARIFACVMVVWVHVTTTHMNQIPKENDSIDGSTCLLITSASRTCVPLFLMISGYLLLAKKQPLFSFYRKRIPRLLLPLIAWGTIYILFRMIWHNNQISIFSAIRLILTNQTFFHLYFLYDLFWLYTIIPFLQACEKNDKQLLRLVFFAWCAYFIFILPFGNFLTDLTGQNCHLYISCPLIHPFLGYLIAGHIIGNLPHKRSLLVPATLLTAASIVMTTILTRMEYQQDLAFSEKYFDYLSPLTIITSICVFYLFKYTDFGLFPRIIRQLSVLTFGVYLIHPLVLEVTAIDFMKYIPSHTLSSMAYAHSRLATQPR